MKQKRSHSQYFLSLINFSQISSDKYLNSVYPLEYLEYSSSLYHKPIHFFTFTLELIFTFHCPKALSTETTRHCTCTCHLSHSMISITSMTGTVMTLHVTCMLTCVTWRQSPQSVWHVTCKLLTWQADLDVWYSRVILTEAAGQWQHVTWHASWWLRDMWRCDGGLATGRLAPGLLDAGHQTRTQCLMLLY